MTTTRTLFFFDSFLNEMNESGYVCVISPAMVGKDVTLHAGERMFERSVNHGEKNMEKKIGMHESLKEV
jgi:hypothetical protein